MQRLVYAPKVFAWVKREGHAEPFNLTPYITGGSVTRRVNKVSSAELTIRNPNRKFTRETKEGKPFFRPMDPITIWMSRLRNYPVQVFTGYIDRSPYIQLHPGVVNIMASCTLKRLLHTYWDPALPYVEEFMREYNWIVNRQTGTLDNRLNVSQDMIDQHSDKNDEDRQTWIEKYQPWNMPDKQEKELDKAELKDGSVGRLLYATLKNVGNWDSDTIKIEKLPPDLIDHVTSIYYAFSEDSEAAKTEIKHYLKKLIGEGDFSGALNGIDGVGGDVSTGDVKGADRIVPIMVDIAEAHNVPSVLVVTVGLIETMLTGKDTPGNPHYGWFQMQTANPPYAYGRFSKRAPSLSETHDLGIATTAFCEAAAGWVNAHPGLRNNLQQWAMSIQGVNCGNNPRFCGSSWTSLKAQAEALIAKHGNKSPSQDRRSP